MYYENQNNHNRNMMVSGRCKNFSAHVSRTALALKPSSWETGGPALNSAFGLASYVSRKVLTQTDREVEIWKETSPKAYALHWHPFISEHEGLPDSEGKLKSIPVHITVLFI